MGIRNAAKAIIINENKILVNKNQNSLGDMCYGLPNEAIYYDLPGGGQNQYETLEEAVKRECMEESGYTIGVDKLAAIYEEISMNEHFRLYYESYAHKIHFIFLCHLIDEPLKPLGEKDLDMLTSEWVDVDKAEEIPLYPKVIMLNLKKIINTQTIIYLGSERI